MTSTIPNLPSKYDPFTTEAKWQTYWEEKQTFKADPNHPGSPYCIMIPPPNVTGSLHMGHAFNNSLIDTLIRYHRMRGYNTLYLPGTDHASIAVHSVIERQLKQEGKTRFDLGREKFLERAWEWKEQSSGTITGQLRRLGISADWTRERFTLDVGLANAVIEAFVRLYEDGLIYRGQYMVNWCPASESAVSDVEVENKEVQGNLWHFRYPLTEGNGYVEVATTRPETMLGDTAVAVNPNDNRYKHLIGKTVTLPIMNREIPIIADEFVDPEFGTGCVKVTPAHDPNDFQMGQRHQLPMINILNKNGSLNENAGSFEGQDRFVARKNVVKQLEKEEFLVKIEDYKHSVPYSDRGKVPIEPLLSTQWFVKIRPLADKALNCLDNEDSPAFAPERWMKVYRDWLVKLEDWCISRQLWWGHQIPAWYAVSETDGEITDNTPFVVAKTEEEAVKKATEKFGKDVKLQQDPDVLDTWFSSGLWPFSTLGWPEETADLATYFPTNTLSTGFDIIFFWVARMTMMAGYFMDKMPFKTVYIHGLILDENGKKMSKTAGNGIDPLLLINKYGTDAVRYTLIREVMGAGQDIRLEYDREKDESGSVETSRNFTNKIWNASRFVMMNLEGKSPQQLGTPDIDKLELCDQWILSRFHKTVKQTCDYLESYGLGEAAREQYEFIWGDFCDWYIELVKPRLQGEDAESKQVAQQTLAYVLEGILKLLHPFMPHITEEIWHTLTQTGEEDCLAVQSYPILSDDLISSKEDHLLEKTVSKNRELGKNVQASSNWWAGVGNFFKDPKIYISNWWAGVGNFFKDPKIYISNWWAGAGKFLKPYQGIFLTSLIFILAFIAVKVIGAALDAINQFPFLPSIFELIGIVYVVWFIYRNLLRYSDRQKFTEQFKLQMKKIFGSSRRSSGISMKMKNGVSTKLASSKSKQQELPTLINEELETEFELIFGTIRTLRNLRADADIKPKVKVTAILQSDNAKERDILTKGENYLKDLVKIETLNITESLPEDLGQTIAGVIGTVQALIPLAGVVDLAGLQQRTEKKLEKVQKEIESISRRLSNRNFVDKADPEVVQTARDALAEAEKQAEILRDRLQQLQSNS